jgi:hypothetical protein
MKKTTRSMHPQGLCLATLLILLFTLSTGLQAQNIYKCGNRYSQTPCPDASTLNLDDARDAAQKGQSEAATRRDTGLAAALEKDRVAQEKIALARTPVVVPVAAKTAPHSDDGVVHKITPKRIGTKHHRPKAFIAEVPGSEKKPSVKKSGKRKTATPA